MLNDFDWAAFPHLGALAAGKHSDHVCSWLGTARLTRPPCRHCRCTACPLQLFTADPSVPVSTAAPAQGGGYAPTDTSPPLGFGSAETLNTLDEPVWETVKRDLRRIYKNLVMVVFPFKDRSQQSAALRNWDLWGPMIFVLGLAITLSLGAQTASKTFSVRWGQGQGGQCCAQALECDLLGSVSVAE